jgi:hypothetical protein
MVVQGLHAFLVSALAEQSAQSTCVSRWLRILMLDGFLWQVYLFAIIHRYKRMLPFASRENHRAAG